MTRSKEPAICRGVSLARGCVVKIFGNQARFLGTCDYGGSSPVKRKATSGTGGFPMLFTEHCHAAN